MMDYQQEFSALMMPGGVAICEKRGGVQILIRSANELKQLQGLLSGIVMIEANLQKESPDNRAK